MKIVFVGDRPSSKNTSPSVPFEGTQSGKVLKNWFDALFLPSGYVGGYVVCKSHMVVNSHRIGDLLHIIELQENKNVFISLGNTASKRLTKLGVPHFKLPHPSRLNRQLNDSRFINKKLQECKDWIQSKDARSTCNFWGSAALRGAPTAIV